MPEVKMSRSMALLVVVFFAGCSTAPPLRGTETTRNPPRDLPASQPPRRDSLHDLGGGRALLVPAARIGDDRINECSGIAYAGGAWWTHNDSGDGPVVFRSDSPWFLTATRHEIDGAAAVDWEELAVLGDDLLACDIGDNARSRDDLTIYRLGVGADGAHLVATYPVAYPDGRHDAEGVWVWDGRVHVAIKNRGEDSTGIYRFDELRDAGDLAEGERNIAVRIGTVNLLPGEQVTAADSSADGLVVLLTYSQALFFTADSVAGDPIASFNLNARQCEAVAWTASGIVFANEQRDVYMVDDPLGCELTWWLPPRAAFALPTLPKGAERELLFELPVENLRASESVRMGIVGGAFVIDAQLQPDNAILISDGRLGTSAVVAFAAEPNVQPTSSDRLFAVIVPPDQPLAVKPFSMFGTPANVEMTGISIDGSAEDELFTFRLVIEASAVFPDGVPERFLFQFVTNGFRTGPAEPLLSGLDFYSLMRPFTWADVTVR